MRVILLGAPGSGKGTQSVIISKKFNLKIISVGDILRKIIKNRLILGLKIKKFLENGKLLPDKLITEIVMKYMKNISDNFIIDGFPRTLNQAQSIKINKIKVDYVFDLILPKDLILSRICGRMIHESSGRIYHNQLNPPKKFGIDDITGEPLSIRNDDNSNIIKNRVNDYFNNRLPIKLFYINEHKNKRLIYKSIDSTRKIKYVNESITKFIKSKAFF